MDIGDIVSITVSRATQAPSQVGFKTIGLLAYHEAFTDYAREYNANATGLAQMVTDGIATTDPPYLMASSLISQNPHPKTLRLLRRATKNVHAVRLEPDTGGVVPPALTVQTITITKDGTSRTYPRTSAGVSKNAEATAIAAAINADTAGWGSGSLVAVEFTCIVSDDGGGAGTGDSVEIDVVAGNQGEIWFYSDIDNLLFEDLTPDPGLAADITAINTLGSTDYYGICMDSRGQGEISGLAAVVETDMKIFGYATKDYEVPTVGAGDIMTTLSGNNYDRSFGMSFDEDSDMSDYPEVAWMAERLSSEPGDATWAFTSSLSGVVASPFTGAQEGFIEGKEGNHYTTTAGIDHTFPGTVASGEFIDIITLTDWAVARTQEAVFGLQVGAGKVPYTDQGVKQIKAQVFSVLRRQMKEDDSGGFIKGSETWDATAVADLSTANKTIRHMPDLTAGVLFTNAIHTVGLALTMTF